MFYIKIFVLYFQNNFFKFSDYENYNFVMLNNNNFSKKMVKQSNFNILILNALKKFNDYMLK